MPEPRTWLRRDGESAKAYKAFTLYRDMDPRKRSIEAAWAEYQNGTGAVSGYFRKWSVDYEWVARSDAYEAHRETERLAEQGTAEIEAFRDRQRQLAAATTAAAIKILTRLNKRLDSLEAEDITPQMIPAYARAVAAVAEASTNAEAAVNGVTALLKQLENEGGARG